MTPSNFQESNCVFNPPPDLDESQCAKIHAYKGQIKGGSVDGADVVVVAWKPTDLEIQAIRSGSLIYLSCLGGLPPHCITTNFQQAIGLQ